MRCTGWQITDPPAKLRRCSTFVRPSAPDSLPALTADLLEAAQDQGLMRLVGNSHRYYELAWAALQGVGSVGARRCGMPAALLPPCCPALSSTVRACTCSMATTPAWRRTRTTTVSTLSFPHPRVSRCLPAGMLCNRRPILGDHCTHISKQRAQLRPLGRMQRTNDQGIALRDTSCKGVPDDVSGLFNHAVWQTKSIYPYLAVACAGMARSRHIL